MTAVRPRIEWIFWPVVALAIVGVAVAGAAFLLTGGRFLIIRTPSMGEYAPVGTLVLSTVFPFARLRAGDMIVFHPPGTAETYFHPVHSIAGGLISTEGDINGSVDPWRLTAHDIVGHEVAKFQGVGWVVQMLPYIVIGAVAMHILVHYYVPFLARVPVLVVGYSTLLSIASLIVKPFVRGVVETQLVEHGKVTVIFVSSGILGLNVQAVGGTGVNLAPGQVGEVATRHIDANGRFGLAIGPHLGVGEWIGLVALWLIPLGVSVGWAIFVRSRGWDLIAEQSRPGPDHHSAPTRPKHQPNCESPRQESHIISHSRPIQLGTRAAGLSI